MVEFSAVMCDSKTLRSDAENPIILYTLHLWIVGGIILELNEPVF